MTIVEYLQQYKNTLYPMHMPGGKRRFVSRLPYDLDMTEVAGTDNLHDPKTFLRSLQERMATLWGAERSFLLVNGSTGGILSAVRATGEGTILLARNCHRSAFHAAELCFRRTQYVYPTEDGTVLPQDVEAMLNEHPDITTVLIVSPTYEGVAGDVASIAAVCRKHNAVLIVDEAHGAHFGLEGHFPPNAITQGADITVQSLHKTLPALTQTAVLHCKEAFASAIARENAVFETSSPSFLLMASADECVTFLESEDGKKAFSDYALHMTELRSRLERELRHLHLETGGVRDIGKLFVRTDGWLYGEALATRLRTEYGFETEMATPNGLLAMTSVCDEKEMLDAFADALIEIDATLTERNGSVAPPRPIRAQKVLELFEARRKESEPCRLDAAVGRVAAGALWAYPPGIPLFLPGERVSEELLRLCDAYTASGVELHATTSGDGICVLK